MNYSWTLFIYFRPVNKISLKILNENLKAVRNGISNLKSMEF